MEMSTHFICYMIYYCSPLVGWIFVVKIVAVTLENTKYMICNTPTTPSRSMIHTLQVLATYMPQYTKSILLRAKMNIFTCTKIALPSEFQCESKALIFTLIGHELKFFVTLLQTA